MKLPKVSKFIRDTLLDWFYANQRDLPWRRTYNPYHIWISEIMLQQTQMDRVVEYFNRWTREFPDIDSLAAAPEQSVLKAWEGLGYYSRARNIMKAARLMVEQYGSRVPDAYEQLLGLPGIGPYTAGAIMSIAFEQPYPVIDANVERLFARLGDVDRPMKDKGVQDRMRMMLKNMLQEASARDINQGLMEFGALVCKPASPECGICPVRHHCLSLQAGTVTERPVKKQKQQTIDIVMACVILENDGKLFIQQRRNDDVWGGLWEFPGGRLKNGEAPGDAALRELYEETEIELKNLEPFATVKHSYTKYRVTLHSFFGILEKEADPVLHAAQQYRWVPFDRLSDYAFPSGHRQLIDKMKLVNSQIG